MSSGVKSGSVQDRLLYCFQGRQVAIVAHMFHKEGRAVPPQELAQAAERKRLLETNPDLFIRRKPWRKEV